MNDTQRLDSLDLHGLCITRLDELQGGKWSSRWVCHFGIDQSVTAMTIREALDKAVAIIEEGESHVAEEGLQQEDHQQEHFQREGSR